MAKGALAELIAELSSLATHPHGTLPLLQLLSPRDKRYFSPEQLSVMGSAESTPTSKKEPATRRRELLTTLLPPLLALCAERAVELACSPHGSAILYEALRVAAADEGGEHVDALKTALGALAKAALATAPAGSLGSADGDGGGSGGLVVAHPIGARVIKRLVQAQPTFAAALLPVLRGSLLKLAKQGAGWVVLALLESAPTKADVAVELKGSAAALAKLSAAGCRSLGEALGSSGGDDGKAKAKAKAKAKK